MKTRDFLYEGDEEVRHFAMETPMDDEDNLIDPADEDEDEDEDEVEEDEDDAE